MKLKIKNIFLTSALAGASITALAVVSCGGVQRFDTNFDETVNIDVPWTREQLESMNELARVFNEKFKADDDFLQVIVSSKLGNNYGATDKQLTLELKSQSKTTIPNLVVNYGSTLANINQFEMALDFSAKTVGGIENKYAINRDQFEETFVNSNDRIGGLPKNSLYAFPLTKSTDLLGVNSPVLSYIFESMVKLGATVDKSDPEFKTWYEGILSEGAASREYIKSEWGTVREAEEKSKYANYTISKDTFSVTKNFFDFARKAQSLFSNTHENPKGRYHILTFSNIVSFIYISLFSLTAKEKDDYSNFVTKIGSGGFVDYSAYENKNSVAFQKLTEITKELIDTAKTGAVYVGSGYSSDAIRQHQTAFAYGSSAGYSFAFQPSETEEQKKQVNRDAIILQLDDKLQPNDKELTYGVLESGTTFPVEYKEVNRKNKNKIFKSTETPGRFDLKLADAASDTSFQEFLTTHAASADKDKKVAIFYNSKDLDAFFKAQPAKLTELGWKIIGKTVKEETVNNAKTNVNYNIYASVGFDSSSKYNVELNGTKIFKYIPNNISTRLQENQLFALPGPAKWDSTDKLNSVFLQGPSLLMLHTNDKEDIATAKFAKWLTTTEKYKFRYSNKDSDASYLDANGKKTTDISKAVEETPFQYLSRRASYIVPYKGAFKNKPTKMNKYLSIAFDEFKNVVDKPNWSFVEEPADSLSGGFRSAFESAFNTPLRSIFIGSTSVTDSYETEIVKRVSNNFTYK